MIYDFQRKADELRPYRVPFVLSPGQWSEYDSPTDLRWRTVRFDPGETNNVPEGPKGVYTFIVKPGIANHDNCSYLLYVGMTEDQDFRARFKQYIREKKRGRPHIIDMLNRWEGYLWFCYAEIDSDDIIQQTEDELLIAYLPPFNKSYPGRIRDAMKVLR